MNITKMKRLTEEMVVARTKISDLSKVKKLNCWGSELSDITLVRRMPNVEVLSLSVNKINILADLEQCRHLQELYVRQNEIKDLNQVCYLQNLPNLKHLWLSENPCACLDGYRLAVIRALPQLQKLDNQPIQVEELSEALKKGRVLTHPEDDQESEQITQQYIQSTYGNNGQTNYREQYYHSPERSPPRQEPECEAEETIEYYIEDEQRDTESPARQSPPRRQELKQSYSPEPEERQVYYEDRRNANSYEQESPKHQQQQYYDKSPVKDDVEEAQQGARSDSPKEIVKELKIPISLSTNAIKDYTNGDRHYHHPMQYKHEGGSEGSNNSHPAGYENCRIRERERCDKNICPANHRPPFNRRPVTRNSSILSAVLCLVKELDYASLEVVEMAVRCRMDELDE